MGASDDSLNPEKLQQGPVTPLAGAHPLQEAALAVAVRSATPVVVQEGLNPAVKPSASSFSSVAKAVRALAGAAAARWEQAYEFRVGRRGGSGFVEGAGPRRGEGEGSRERGGQGFPGFGGGDAGGTNHPFAVQTTLLTDEQRVEMERARVERQQRLAEFQAMTPAQRLQRVAEMVDGGGSATAQQRHQQRMLRRIMNTTPEQKVKMNQRMEQRLQRLQQRLQQQSSAPAPQRGR